MPISKRDSEDEAERRLQRTGALRAFSGLLSLGPQAFGSGAVHSGDGPPYSQTEMEGQEWAEVSENPRTEKGREQREAGQGARAAPHLPAEFCFCHKRLRRKDHLRD